MIIQKSFKNNSSFLLFTVVLLIVLAALFIPKLSANFPPKQQHALSTFLQHTQQTQEIDSREFWQFREFYSPGHFFLAKDNYSDKIVPQIMSLEADLNKIVENSYFVSPNMQSIDGLTTAKSLSSIMKLPKATILIKKDTLVVYKTPDNVVIAFLLPPSILKTTNGFLYKLPDSELQGKNWVDISVIKTN